MPKVATRVDVGAVVAALDDRAGEPDDVDRRILDAAGALLVAEGLAAVELDRIAAAAGVGRSTIYRRFEGRNALLAAAAAHEARRVLAALAEAVDATDNPVDQVVSAFTTGLTFARASGLADRIRAEPLLLRLVTVDAAPVLAAGRAQLVALAANRAPGVPAAIVERVADVLLRLAVSYVISPDPALDAGEDAVRAVLAPLLRGSTGTDGTGP